MSHDDVHKVRPFEHPGEGRRRAKATPKGRQVDPTVDYQRPIAGTMSITYGIDASLTLDTWEEAFELEFTHQEWSMDQPAFQDRLAQLRAKLEKD